MRRCRFRSRIEWILDHRGFPSLRDFSLRAGMSAATINNRMKAAEMEDREPTFQFKSYTRMAGAGRVSLSWLQGYSKNPDGDDIPPPPKVSAADIKRRRFSYSQRVRELEAEVAALRSKLPPVVAEPPRLPAKKH